MSGFRIDELPIGVRFASLIISGLNRGLNGYVQHDLEDAEVVCDFGGEKRIYCTEKKSKKRIWFSVRKDGPYLLIVIVHTKKQKTFYHIGTNRKSKE